MSASIAHAVSLALPPRDQGDTSAGTVDLSDLQHQLEEVSEEALAARREGIGLAQAVRDPRFGGLHRFHQDLRDALFVEIPRELEGWVERLQAPQHGGPRDDFAGTLTRLARDDDNTEGPDNAQLQQVLAELLLFEAVRLRLLVAALDSDEFERLGGEESDIDEIAWAEVEALLDDPAVDDPRVRPVHLMYASASVALARDAAERAGALLTTGPDLREQLSMRARLRAALRELRLPESVLLENALSSLMGAERLELPQLQAERPVALEGLSRQAMDQRVSRGRRALTRAPSAWPKRRRPALFDLLRGVGEISPERDG